MELKPSGVALAVDIGGTTIKAEVIDDQMNVLARSSAPTPAGDRLVDTLGHIGAHLLDGLLPEQRERVRAVGVALPGVVDPERGVSIYAANLGLQNAPIGDPLSQRLKLPVVVGHDVAMAADAERRLGAASDVEDPVVVVIGTGIAAVSYVGGRPVRGVTGQAGELGHLVVRSDGPQCACGSRGCLEAVASATAIVRAYEGATRRRVDGSRAVFQLLGHDQAANRVWAEATAALADGLLAVVALLAPGAIILGGGLAEAGDALVKPVVNRMAAQGLSLSLPPIRTAHLGSRAGVVGAALLAFDSAAH